MHDLIVLSDLHLGRGKNPDTGRYFSLEAFFYDDDLRRFCHWLCEDARARGATFKLILNGDTFDLLRIEPDPAEASTQRERRFGPTLTPATAARLLGQILAGHPVFLDGLAHVLRHGHEVVFLPGNHDVELQWPTLQAEVRRALLDRIRLQAGDQAADAAEPRLRFEPWFYHEPGRIWIEHGCQYDPENAFRYLLREGLCQLPDAVHEVELDMPLGNFFQRYLYNEFGSITFMVPSTRANLRYFKWLLVHQPRLLARVLASHGPFVLQLVRRLSRSARAARRELERVHGAELQRLAEQSGLGDRLRTIEGLKNVQGDITRALRQVGWQLVKLVSASLLVALSGAGLWFAGFHAINQLRVGFGPKAVMFLGLNFLFLAAMAIVLIYWLLRAPPGAPQQPLWRAAARIADLVDVPLVTFGHTHDEVITRIDRPSGQAWYLNTGTWIAVFTHDVLVPRERVQFTFLRVKGTQGELLHFSPGRGEPQPVVLLDDEDHPFSSHPHHVNPA